MCFGCSAFIEAQLVTDKAASIGHNIQLQESTIKIEADKAKYIGLHIKGPYPG